MMMKKKVFVALFLLTLALVVRGQQYLGHPGLIHVPTADMDTVGVARVGAHYIPKEMMPDRMTLDGEKFNSFTNYLSITPFRWIQISYGYTLWKFHQNQKRQNKVGFFSKDRYFSLRLQPLREGKWWPSVVIGSNDVLGSRDGESSSNYYRNYYVAASKHFNLGGHIIGGHLAYRYWTKDFNHKWNGVVGGITYQPSFYQPLRVMCEWDGNEVNIGVDCRLFKYFLVQCALLDWRRFNAGLCLYIPLL